MDINNWEGLYIKSTTQVRDEQKKKVYSISDTGIIHKIYTQFFQRVQKSYPFVPHIPFREWTTPGLNSVNTVAIILDIWQIRSNYGGPEGSHMQIKNVAAN